MLGRSRCVFTVLVPRLPIMVVGLNCEDPYRVVDWFTRLVAYVSELSPQFACASSVTGPILCFSFGH